MCNESSCILQNNISENHLGNSPELEFKYLGIQLFHITASIVLLVSDIYGCKMLFQEEKSLIVFQYIYLSWNKIF